MHTVAFNEFEVPESVYPEGGRAPRGRILNAVLGSLLVAPGVIMGASEVVTSACDAKLIPAAMCAANTAFQHTVADVASIVATQLPDLPAPVVGRPVDIG